MKDESLKSCLGLETKGTETLGLISVSYFWNLSCLSLVSDEIFLDGLVPVSSRLDEWFITKFNQICTLFLHKKLVLVSAL